MQRTRSSFYWYLIKNKIDYRYRTTACRAPRHPASRHNIFIRSLHDRTWTEVPWKPVLRRAVTTTTVTRGGRRPRIRSRFVRAVFFFSFFFLFCFSLFCMTVWVCDSSQSIATLCSSARTLDGRSLLVRARFLVRNSFRFRGRTKTRDTRTNQVQVVQHLDRVPTVMRTI